MIDPVDREFRTIDEQLREGELDLSYWAGAGVYKLEWQTDSDIENTSEVSYLFDTAEYYNSGTEVMTLSKADEAWMKNRMDGGMNRYLKYDEERGVATAAARPENITDIVDIVGTLEQWDELQDERDVLWTHLNSAEVGK